MTLDPPPADRRRRLASIAVLVVAGLASAATSARPSPPPVLSSESSGSLTLTRDGPVASVDLTVTANDTLLSAPGANTIIRVQRAVADNATNAATVLSIVRLDGPPDFPHTGVAPSVFEPLSTVCQNERPCTRHYRLTAALLDPSVDGPVVVRWTAAAETRIGPDTGASQPPAPSGSVLSVTTGREVAADAERIVRAATPLADARLDAAHPRFVVPVTLIRPPSTAAGMTERTVLRWTADADHEQPYQSPRVSVGVELNGAAISRGGYGTEFDIDLPVCDNPAGCSDQLAVTGVWLGGVPDDAATVHWSIASGAFATSPDGDVPAKVTASTTPKPALQAEFGAVARATGSLVTGGQRSTDRNVVATIEGLRMTGGGAASHSFVQFTLKASTASRGHRTDDVRVGLAGWSTAAPVGTDQTFVSALTPIDCSGGICRASAGLVASAYQAPGDDISVDWEITAKLVTDPGVVAADATVKLEVTERAKP